MVEPVRVRVVFDDRKMLTKSQRSEGLKRCWLLLNPCIATISDLESHVRRSFNLKDSCPHGLVLSMDDFVLPPFESACVLKDKDIIRVGKKDAPQFGVIDLGDDPYYIQDSGDVEKQYTVSSDKLLAIREFDEDSGHKRINDKDLCAHNDNAIDTGTPLTSKKKRKHSDGIQGAMNVQVEENVGGSICETHDGSMAKVRSRNDRRKKLKRQLVQELKSKEDQNTQSQISPNAIHKELTVQQEADQNTELGKEVISAVIQQEAEHNAELEKEIVPVVIRPGHIRFQPIDEEQSQWQSHETMETLNWNGTTSKKNGQKWGRENTVGNWNDANGYKQQCNEKEKNTSKWNDANGYDANGYKQQCNEKENTVGNWNDANGYKQQCNKKEKYSGGNTVGNWNDANGYKQQCNEKEKNVSKWNDANGYNGQKWDNEKSVRKWNDANNYKGQKFPRDRTMSKWNHVNCYKEQPYSKQKTVSKWNDANGCREQSNAKANNWNNANEYRELSNNKSLSGKGQTGSNEIDFESLLLLTRIPQVGDVLAYRLTELSSSWCPEVSSFRVGQVTSYDYVSESIILVPVPEYPIFSDEDIERRDSMLQANSSPYNEVGSLQIHYPSLVDVRLLKGSDSEATTSDYPGVEMISTQGEAPVNNWELVVVQTSTNSTVTQMSTQETVPVNNWEVAVVNSKAKETVVQPTANGSAGVSTWDQIKQALNEKKAQLQQKKKDGWDEWTPSKSTASTSWSYRALRRSAVGPTLAYLRGRNDKRPRGK